MKNENEHKKKRRRESDDDNTKLEGRTAAGPSVSPKKSKTEEPQVKRAEDGSPDEKKDVEECLQSAQKDKNEDKDLKCASQDRHQEQPVTSDQPQRKRKRRVRVKKVREDLKQQMEFYFCDANLRKDRFMTELVSKAKDGWVEVSTFLKFNKIKTLLEEKGLEIGEVIKAVNGSELLEVSDDFKSIRRDFVTHPIKTKSQQMVNDCTIYVQGLPQIASVDWLREVFSEFGYVEYVSLPRAPNGRHKGFGFVEFAEVIGAENACKFYNLRGGCSPGSEAECAGTSGSNWSHAGGYGGSFSNNVNNNHTNMSNNGNSQHLAHRANLQVLSNGPADEAVHEPHQERRSNSEGKRSGDQDGPHVSKRARTVDESDKNSEDDARRTVNGDLAKQPIARKAVAKLHLQSTEVEGALGTVNRRVKGCIVKIKANKGLLKADKALMRVLPGVAYVDMIENDPVAFIRFNSPEEAVAFSISYGNQQSCKDGKTADQPGSTAAEKDAIQNFTIAQCTVLDGQEEESYWQTVEMMQQRKKRSNRTKTKDGANVNSSEKDAPRKNNRRPRGRQRLNEKYKKYINQAERKIEIRMNKRIVFDN
ncbi:la-related protein 6A-like isoform X2 [Varroa jacobsoni]|uniref:La-related protein 7 n=1 Tax=Varroa destructor TaxID=109461 RepID=A0A7M7JNV5_VARDE|nr:la-related protein 6A-like isoform X2 [Varroa destructor]XP_022690032.1 la-related protein 6A-like isoform X2 [Varroa jacobsoni]